jgi:hypothetical protein
MHIRSATTATIFKLPVSSHFNYLRLNDAVHLSKHLTLAPQNQDKRHFLQNVVVAHKTTYITEYVVLSLNGLTNYLFSLFSCERQWTSRYDVCINHTT